MLHRLRSVLVRPASTRTIRDAEVKIKIDEIFRDCTKGRGVSSVRKVWRLLKRDGVEVAKCTVERLMRDMGLQGVRRGKKIVTIKADDSAARPPDRVNRDFTASKPNELWIVERPRESLALVREGPSRGAVADIPSELTLSHWVSP